MGLSIIIYIILIERKVNILLVFDVAKGIQSSSKVTKKLN